MATSSESYIVVAGATFVFGLGIEGYYGERHRFNVRTTEYPVETGADLTDHVVREPYRVKLRGAATAFARGVSAGPDAWGSAIAHINRREPVTIITRLGTYRNMMLVSGDATVDENTERSLDVDLEFKEVLRAHVMRSPVSAGSSAAGGIPTEGRALDRIERAAFGGGGGCAAAVGRHRGKRSETHPQQCDCNAHAGAIPRRAGAR